MEKKYEISNEYGRYNNIDVVYKRLKTDLKLYISQLMNILNSLNKGNE